MKRFLHRLAAFGAVALVAIGSAPSVPVSARTAPPESQADATHPRVMQEVANSISGSGNATPGNVAAYSFVKGPINPTPKPATPAGSSVPPLPREVFGFAFGNASLGDPTYGYPGWSFNLLTTIAYFGLSLQWDGTIIQSGSGWSTWNSSALTGLIATAHANRDRVILSINLHDFSTSNVSTMCAALHPTHRAVTIAQTIAQIQRMNADGVNLDYEGDNTVCQYQVGHPELGPDLQSEHTALVREFRAQLPAPYYLSVDTYSGSAGYSGGFFDIPGMAPYVNSFFVMAYDMEYYNWGSYPLSCTSFCLGPTAPLTTYNYNDAGSMANYIAVVPRSKIILGVPYYGRKECVANATPTYAPS